MQRTTGFSAAVVLELLAQGKVEIKGFAPLEKAVHGRTFLDQVRRRGIHIKEDIHPI
jgi:saccharopine dehydrogenase-like NADP-dependent oxidoreductase